MDKDLEEYVKKQEEKRERNENTMYNATSLLCHKEMLEEWLEEVKEAKEELANFNENWSKELSTSGEYIEVTCVNEYTGEETLLYRYYMTGYDDLMDLIKTRLVRRVRDILDRIKAEKDMIISILEEIDVAPWN